MGPVAFNIFYVDKDQIKNPMHSSKLSQCSREISSCFSNKCGRKFIKINPLVQHVDAKIT